MHLLLSTSAPPPLVHSIMPRLISFLWVASFLNPATTSYSPLHTLLTSQEYLVLVYNVVSVHKYQGLFVLCIYRYSTEELK